MGITTKSDRKALAVLISDVHYSMATLEVADTCMLEACSLAADLNTRLVISGDLHDTKAIIRAECMNRMVETFSLYIDDFDPYILRGNHDSINEKSEDHALGFLKAACNPHIVATPVYSGPLDCFLIPYYHNTADLRAYLSTLPDNARIIMHQGLEKALPGEYTHDKAALTLQDVSRFKVMSGHYHAHQVIDTGAGNTFTYVGNPYTLNFGEANDPRKGFLVLYTDFSFEFVPTSARRHIIIECDAKLSNVVLSAPFADTDIVMVRASGPKSDLCRITRKQVVDTLGVPNTFRLDLVPTDSAVLSQSIERNQSPTAVFSSMIGQVDELTAPQKDTLLRMWGDFSK